MEILLPLFYDFPCQIRPLCAAALKLKFRAKSQEPGETDQCWNMELTLPSVLSTVVPLLRDPSVQELPL